MKLFMPDKVELETYPDDVEFIMSPLCFQTALFEFYNRDGKIKELSKNKIKECIDIIENNSFLTRKQPGKEMMIVNKKALDVMLLYVESKVKYEFKDIDNLEKAYDYILRKRITTADDEDIKLYLSINAFNDIKEAKKIITIINNSHSKNKREFMMLLKAKMYSYLLRLNKEVEEITNKI